MQKSAGAVVGDRAPPSPLRRMEIGMDCLRACRAHFADMCEFLNEPLDETSFWNGYFAYEAWKLANTRCLLPDNELPLAS